MIDRFKLKSVVGGTCENPAENLCSLSAFSLSRFISMEEVEAAACIAVHYFLPFSIQPPGGDENSRKFHIVALKLHLFSFSITMDQMTVKLWLVVMNLQRIINQLFSSHLCG